MNKPLISIPSDQPTNLLDDIERVLGSDDFAKFMNAFAGQRVYFSRPERLRPKSALVLALGWDAARRLCAFVTTPDIGEHLSIPTDDYSSFVEDVRNRRATGMQMLIDGASTNEVAARLNACQRTVFRWRKKLRDRGKI